MWHIFYIKCEPFRERRSIRLYYSIFEIIKLKLVPAQLFSIPSKFIRSHLYLLYSLSFLSIICNYLQNYYLQHSSVKPISRITFVDKCHWLVMISLTYYFFLRHFFLTAVFVFSNSHVLTVLIAWYHFPSLNWVIKLTVGTVSHMEISDA